MVTTRSRTRTESDPMMKQKDRKKNNDDNSADNKYNDDNPDDNVDDTELLQNDDKNDTINKNFMKIRNEKNNSTIQNSIDEENEKNEHDDDDYDDDDDDEEKDIELNSKQQRQEQQQRDDESKRTKSGETSAEDNHEGVISSNSARKKDKRKTNSKKRKKGLASNFVFNNMTTTTTTATTTTTKKKKQKNELTKILPGYTAPMTLNSSSLDQYRPAGGIQELQRRAQRTDKSTKDFVVGQTTMEGRCTVMQKTSKGLLPKSYATAYSSFKRGTKPPPDATAGKRWFGMTPSEMTEELKTDLAVIRNRSYLDPKRFYKSADRNNRNSIVQVGTVIEGATEFYSSRLTKRQRRTNFTDEIMADPSVADYTKKKYKKMQQEKTHEALQRKRKPNKKVKKFY